MNKELQGIFLALAGTLLLSTKSIFIKLLLAKGISPTAIMGLRVAVGIPFYVLLAIWLLSKTNRKQWNTRVILQICVLGIALFHVAAYLDVLGLQYINASLERLILYSYPTLVVLLSMVFFGRKVTWLEAVAISVIYVGLLLVFEVDLKQQGSQVWLGGGLVLMASFVTAGYLIGSQKLGNKVGSTLFTCVSMLAASVTVFIQYVWQHPLSDLWVDAHSLFLVMLVTYVATILPSFLLNAAIIRITAANVSIIGCIGPLATALMAVAVLDERLNLLGWLGIAIVILGVFAQGRFRHKTS